jgi:hypothetical protein
MKSLAEVLSDDTGPDLGSFLEARTNRGQAGAHDYGNNFLES